MPADNFSKIFLHDLWIFQSSAPGPLAADQDAVKNPNGPPPNPFTYSLAGGPVAKQTRGGMVQIADSNTFKASTTIAAALVTVPPGGMREMHWHPNADEWQYYVKGSAQMTVFNTGPRAVTNNFNAGDIGYIKANFGHYIENVGDTDLVFLEIFKTDSYQDISLSDWLTPHAAGDGRGPLQPVTSGYRQVPQQQSGCDAGLKPYRRAGAERAQTTASLSGQRVARSSCLSY